MRVVDGERTADGKQPRGLRSGVHVWRATPARLDVVKCSHAKAASNADWVLLVRILTQMLLSNSQIQSTFLLLPSTPLSSNNSTTITLQPSPVPPPPLSVQQSVPVSSLKRRPPLSQEASAEETFTSAQAPPFASTPVFPSDSLSARAIMSILPLARPSFHDSFVLVDSYRQSYVNTSLNPSFTIFPLSPHILGAITTPCTPM